MGNHLGRGSLLFVFFMFTGFMSFGSFRCDSNCQKPQALVQPKPRESQHESSLTHVANFWSLLQGDFRLAIYDA